MKPIRKLGPWFRLTLAPLAVLVGLTLLVADPLPLQLLRHNLFDQYQRWAPRPYTAAPVRIVDIDEASLRQWGQWPWPRTQVAELVMRLEEAGAAAIALDTLLVEPDRTAPRALVKLWGLTGEQAKAISERPDPDAILAHTLQSSPTVLGIALLREPTALGAPTPRAPVHRIVQLGEPTLGALHSFGGAVFPLPTLAQAAPGLGALTFVPDGDGVVRRVPLVFAVDGQVLPSLTAETLRVAQGTRNLLLKSAPGGGLESIRIGQVTVPTTAQGEVWVHYTLPVPERVLSAGAVLDGKLPPGALQGQLVVVGTSAPGLQDLRFSPLGRIVPGVEIHAQALEQMLSGGGLQRPDWARGFEALLLLVAGGLMGTLALTLRALRAAAWAVALLSSMQWGGWWLFSREGLLLDTLTPALAGALCFVVASLARHFATEQRQRFVRQAFARYVSPNLVDYLIGHPDRLELGGTRRNCSFIFTDLAGSTSLIEKVDPQMLVSLLNAYLDGLIATAFRHQGTLARIAGDGVLIMFSAPLPQPDHCARALACARALDAFATQFARQQQALGVSFGHTRIGIHSGEVIVGNFGGAALYEYRALGDPVNTAARLESVNKQLGTRLCVSEATLAGCPEVVARTVGRLVLVGKSVPLQTFEPIPEHPEERALRAPLGQYQTAYAHLGHDAARALQAFASLAETYPQDPLVALHLKRLRQGECSDLLVMREK